MTKQIAIIDPYIRTPVVSCFNRLVDIIGAPSTYHMPHLMGLETLQKEKENTSAYIILGSASNVEDNLPWHAPLASFIAEELKNGKPVLGCCFGHQLMCHYFGSSVDFYHENQDKLLGARKITITKDFWNIKQGEVFHFPVTHRQFVKSLGPDLISVGEGLPNDIVIHKSLPFIGTQGHPEASDYFCEVDIQVLSPDDKSLGQKDGEHLIRRFVQYYQL